MLLSHSTEQVCRQMIDGADRLRIGIEELSGGTRILDCGLNHVGGVEAGVLLSEMCLAGLGRVTLGPGRASVWSGPFVMVETDQPLLACLASQYAGWKIASDDFFAMASGPMRAAYADEPLFQQLGYREHPRQTYGVLESSAIPPGELCEQLAAKCGVEPAELTLAVAPTASLAGNLQVVARSVETALHKLHELQFNLGDIVSAWGMAPLPPVGKNDMAGIGRTNDAILYGAEVTLWVRGEDDAILELGSKTPSSASKDFGRPFGEIFRHYEYDFYRIDPMLFSPARVTFHNLETGRTFAYGETRPDLIAQSFLG
jgi:methenyltetrahydromethanopterin cyclohydrolase